MTTSIASPAGEPAMRRCLEPMIAAALSDGPPLRTITWEPFALSTSYAAHLARVHFQRGGTLTLFVKDFRTTVRPKDDPQQRRAREVRTYAELLGTAGMGTARYYGSAWDSEQGWLYLLVEFVAGTPVGYLDIASSWAPAAAALGRLHGRFAAQAEALARLDFLAQHTEEFYWSRLERAYDCVARIAPTRLDELKEIAKRHAPVVALLGDQPRTLVHGGCRPTNILVDIAGEPERSCIIDWEEAACGAPSYDLAYLLDGIAPPLLDPLLDAYRGEALACGLPLPPRAEMKHVIDCFRLHMTIRMLGQAVVKGYRAADVAKLLAIASRLSAAAGRGLAS